MTHSRIAVAALLLLASTGASAQIPTEVDLGRAAADGITLLQELIRLDTSNPPGNETLVAEHLQALFAREGIGSRIVALEPARGNLIARLEGNGAKRPLLLMAHSDVVGVDREKWSVDPFAGVIEDGYLYGRGAIDDKGMMSVLVQVMLLIHRLELPLERDLILLVEAGEEGSTSVGIDYVIEHHWDEIASEFALNEGGGIRKSGDHVSVVAVATTEKVPLRGIRLIARGTAGHGSMPRPDNPIVRLATAVAKLGQWQPPMRLNTTTRAYFSRLAAISSEKDAFLYRNLEDPALTEMIQEKLRLTDILANSTLRTSISPNMISGGFRVNVIPAQAEVVLDVRALPDEDPAELVAALVDLIDDPLIEVTQPTSSRPSGPPSSLDSEMFRALEKAQATLFPHAITLPTMLTAATDSAQLRARGVQAYGVGAVVSEADMRAHGNDERISIEGFAQFLEYVLLAVVDVAVAE